MAAAPPGAGEDIKDGVEVCVFDESADGFLRTVRAISELVDKEPEPDFPEAEVERLSSSITFLREWRHFSYEPKSVTFTSGTESTSSRDDMHSVTLPQFSSASVPQITPQEDRRDHTVSFDFILYAGGNVWALDWCPRLCKKADSSINCEYLAVSAHPPGSSYHKLGMPLTGRGIIQVWCLLAPFEDAHARRSINVCNNSKRRGRPRKIPCSDKLEPIPKGPRGRPRKRPCSDQLEPVPKRPRGRPRKCPLPDAKLEGSSQNGQSQDIILFDSSSVISDDLPLAYVMPTVKSVQSTPKRGRGRPRKNSSDKLTGSSGIVSEAVCTAPSPTTICTKPKGRRGRPRKYPIPMNDGSVSGADVELGKGTTCQPASFGCSLDHNACTEFNANLSIVAVDAALPLIDKPTCSSGTVSGDVCTAPSPKTVICTKPKKPRGRPRKYPVPINARSVSGTVSGDLWTAPSPTTAICTKPKKPRGRPRKYPVPINGRSVSGTDAELGQETTCQPVSFGCSLEHTVCTELNANLSIVPVDAALPIVDELCSSSGAVVKESVCTEPAPATATRKQPKRTRVMPQKYSDTMIELGKDTTSQPVLSSMGHTACTESNSSFSIVAVDASSSFTSPSTATCDKKSKGQMIRGNDKKKTISNALYCPVVSGVESQRICSTEILPNDPAVSVENALPSAQNVVSMNELCSASLLNCEGKACKGAVSDDSVLPIHISPKSSNKRESSGKRGRGRPKTIPLSAGTGRFVASGASLPKTTSVLTGSNNLTSLNKSGGKFIVSSLGSCGCDIEKCSVHSGVLLSDDASPAHGLHNANCKEELNTKIGKGGCRKKPVSAEHSHFTDFNVKEQKMQTTPKSGDSVVLVENCMEGQGPRKAGGQLQRIPASNESSGKSVGVETHKIETLSTPMTKGSSKNDDMGHGAGLNQSKNAIAGCEGMKVTESNTANYTSHCNENARANQVAPSFKNSDRVIDETEAAELVPLKESWEDDNMFSCVNSNSSSITRDIAQPRVVLCLAHNGKVAWDIKWKPPLLSQPEQKSRLGFLAVLLGNGILEVWEVPSPCMIQKIYSSSKVEGSDPRFLKLQPVFRCVKVKCRNRQSIPLTVDWSPTPPHDMILAGCHDGTVALWNFSMNLPTQDSKPFMCVTADSVPIRALSWAPYISEESTNTFVTAGEDGLKFWDLRDPYRPLWELTTAPKAVLSLHWLKDGRGIVICLEDGTLKFLSLPRIANDVPATGRPFAGTKTQGVGTYQLSEYLIWSVHASEPTGCVAYCGADGTAVYFQLNSRFWDKEPGRNRVPYFLSGSLSEEGENIKIGSRLQTSPLPNVPVMTKKGSKPCQNIVQGLATNNVTGLLTCQLNSPTRNSDAVNPEVHDDQDNGQSEEQGAGAVNQEHDGDRDDGHSEEHAADMVNTEFGDDQDDGHSEEQGTGAIILASPTKEENDGTWNSKGGESPKDLKVVPPNSVALHQVRWNMNKGSERWLCYGGAAGIIRCQRI
ncbi:uncharacterized protein LOC8062105 isoform X1 [Sorghum bicolor]|uniref:Transducin/WD40 repeat-like superfamily protein n=1 Tax=Sorghum bicolor TaxID=4558 RepID=A0A1B6Q739_SORBI|nr:uncharacterized protein LOC8062105 isoform X1 [Sorghum bicolor]KXG33730.1 hypothetical protein SORBI_3003G362600 [Sorghum bicolor]|eukprot:XP_021312165.1 uncharacterized protein LOC8062105 isoform X1 [Sorghum bicolor]